MTNYTIFKSNGGLLGTVSANTVNSALTSLTLIGKGALGYGDELNTNFVHLTENFSRPTAPPNPMVGQLWFDSSAKTLSVFYNSSWNTLALSVSADPAPVESLVIAGNELSVIKASGLAYAVFSPTSLSYGVIGATLTAFTTGLGPGLTFSNLFNAGVYGTSSLALGVGTTKTAEIKISNIDLFSTSSEQNIKLFNTGSPTVNSIFRNSGTDLIIEKNNSGSTTTISLNPIAGTNTENTSVRLFRDTNTTGQRALELYRGNGSAEINARIGVDNQNSYVQLGGGNFGVATSAPTEKFEVLGTAKAVQIIVSGQGQSYKLPTSAGTSGQVLATRGNGLETYWVDRGPRIRWEVIDVTSLTVGSTQYVTPDVSSYPEIRVSFNNVGAIVSGAGFRMRFYINGVEDTSNFSNLLSITSGGTTGTTLSAVTANTDSYYRISKSNNMGGAGRPIFGDLQVFNGRNAYVSGRGQAKSSVRYQSGVGSNFYVQNAAFTTADGAVSNLRFFLNGGQFAGGRIVVEALLSS